ncbi:MAG: endonuclease III domain-containing protein [Candidatus Asgardarchaeia archaeon]
MIDNSNIHYVIERVEDFVSKFNRLLISRRKMDPFRILIATVLSSRTKDEVTIKAVERLFSVINSPEELAKLSEEEVSRIIYPVGFYRIKARTIIEISRKICEDYDGKVPDSMEELLKLRGVGRKTANLVLTEAFDKMGICVDTHVHRIFNRWGYVKTRTPYETEISLRERLPKKYWKKINRILVSFGKNVCKPLHPRCDICPINDLCPSRIEEFKGEKDK